MSQCHYKKDIDMMQYETLLYYHENINICFLKNKKTDKLFILHTTKPLKYKIYYS